MNHLDPGTVSDLTLSDLLLTSPVVCCRSISSIFLGAGAVLPLMDKISANKIQGAYANICIRAVCILC